MKPPIKVPITDLCLDYRDDIKLRVFVLFEKRFDVWEAFCNLPANTKNKQNIAKLIGMVRCIQDMGQPEPVKVVRVDGKLYPAMGATRIAAMLSLHIGNIEIIECTKEEAPKWNKSWKLDSKYFEGMPPRMLYDFLCWSNK